MKTKEEKSLVKKIYYQKNRIRILEERRIYQKLHAAKIKQRKRKYYDKNKSFISATGRKYYIKNRQRIISRSVEYERKRIKVDVNYKLKKRLKARLKLALINNYQSGMAIKTLGCSINEFRQYLERRFLPGMTWNNYGEWHIDHIIPCSSFNLSLPQEQIKCFHYSNLQPLWATDNWKKGNTILSYLPRGGGGPGREPCGGRCGGGTIGW